MYPKEPCCRVQGTNLPAKKIYSCYYSQNPTFYIFLSQWSQNPLCLINSLPLLLFLKYIHVVLWIFHLTQKPQFFCWLVIEIAIHHCVSFLVLALRLKHILKSHPRCLLHTKIISNGNYILTPNLKQDILSGSESLSKSQTKKMRKIRSEVGNQT
jgi:hypothetical protein